MATDGRKRNDDWQLQTVFMDSGESGKENSLFGATSVSLEDTAP